MNVTLEMSYLRGACGMSKWDVESNGDMYERLGMGRTVEGVDYGVVEWIKCGMYVEMVWAWDKNE